MEIIVKRLREQIQQIKVDIKEITNEIETYRKEGETEDSGVTREFLDKLEFLTDKVATLKKNLSIYENAKRTNFADIGKTVELSSGQKATKVLTIVLPEDANPQEGFISAESPIGKAVLNKKEGETVAFETPMGSRELKISKIQ
ncbi:hypothetical protein GF362_05265 [Candidatus Dojkabacteria bacterium]|nr:hypothetical protein [Candidatus Dojkabacteria bacterium]